MRRIFLVSLVVALALVVSAPASAEWAGSIYKQSDCTYTAASNTLYCSIANYTYTYTHSVQTFTVADTTCTSGYRWNERTGTYNVTFPRVWDSYTGRSPLAQNNVAGQDEGIPVEFWTHYRDTNKGCA